MTTHDICHFCNTDYKDDAEIILLEGPAHEACICENCVIMMASRINEQATPTGRYGRCDVCGESSQYKLYGQAPAICESCLRITIRLIQLAGGSRHVKI